MKKYSALFTGMILFSIIGQAQASPQPPAPSASRLVQVGVSSAYIPAGFDSTSDVFVVENGYFPNTCYHWDHADVSHTTAYQHEIKSIASVKSGLCGMVMMPFQQEVQLGKLAAGNHIIHFMNGDGTYMEKTLNVEP